MKSLYKKKEFTIFVVLIVIIAVIALTNKTFLRPDNITNIFMTNTVTGITTLGMLLIIISGGIDVSISAALTVITVIIGQFAIHFGGNLFTLTIIACISGMIIGAVNGLLIAKLSLPPIVVTLGTGSILTGIVLLITNGRWIRGLPDYISLLGTKYVFKFRASSGAISGLPVIVLFWIFATVLTFIILKYTVIGRGVFAIGGNEVSARVVGFKPDVIKIFIYTYSGFLAGLGAVVHTGIMRQVDPLAFSGYELQVIATVFVGGASALGGSGSVLGTVLGVLFMGVINNSLVILHIPTFWQKIIIGLAIIIFVSTDIIQQNIKERNLIKIDVKD